MLEQEIASAIKFILDAAGSPTPYYHSVPQDFLAPAVYFPPPEIISAGNTLLSYLLEYSWYVKFFHKSTEEAYGIALKTLTALQDRKNVIPLIDDKGKLTGRGFRISDPSLKSLDNAAQLTIIWKSPRPYQKTSNTALDTASALGNAVLNINETEK